MTKPARPMAAIAASCPGLLAPGCAAPAPHHEASASAAPGHRARAGARRTAGNQDVRTVRNLRLGVGVVGILLPVGLIAGNWMLGDKVIVPSSMSGSYYTSTRNLFVGALCALGVFLIGYRHTERQNRCTWLAGVCAVLVAFAPTAPTLPGKEPPWVNYLHHAAAGVLILTLGLFCLVVFADDSRPGQERPASAADRLEAWAASARTGLRQHRRSALYLICGVVVLAAGALALYTGIWPSSWSTGWPSLYCFEAIAVFAFGAAWIAAGLEFASAPGAPDLHWRPNGSLPKSDKGGEVR